MTEPNPYQFDSLSPEQMLVVNRYCDQFEQLWQQTQDVSLTDFYREVNCTDKRARETLIEELVTLDIQYRRKYLLPARQGVYQSDFPTLRRSLFTWLSENAAARFLETNQLEPGQQIGDYVIEELAGCGGMGQVYRAKHSLMARQVAIKLLQQKNDQDPVAKLRFEREVQSLASLSHPNIVLAFDARIVDDSLYLVTEWAEGVTLSDAVKSDGPLPASEVIEIGIQIACGLEYAHNAGIIHRDVKPSNVVMDDDGHVKILDLGIARFNLAMDESCSQIEMTQSHHLIGTAGFLAPEQARSPKQAGVPSDIYSLGCTLFYLLSGQLPYTGDSPIDVIVKHAHSPTPVLSELALKKSIPRPLSEVVQRMMDKDPARRPASMTEVIETLQQNTRLALTTDREANHQRWRSHRRSLAFTGATIGVVMLGWWAVTSLSRSDSFRGWRGDYRSDSVHSESRPEESAGTGGIRFNGATGYAIVPEFAVPITDKAMIEALVTPRQDGDWPANMVTWSGPETLALFTASGEKWGAASLRNGESKLIVSVEKIVFGEPVIVAAERNGTELRLLLNGKPVSTRPFNYRLRSSAPMLSFGGIPRELYPHERTGRFFAGDIHRLRLSRAPLPSPGTSVEDLHKLGSTVALFDFREATGDQVTDSTRFRWKAQLIHSEWVE